MGYTIVEWFLVFLIYAMIGWCLEVGYAAVQDGKFVNRGFLNGPVCPIYGFGGTIVVASLYQIREQFILVFLGAVVLTTILEFLTGFALDKIFHEHWWDYSDVPFNIKGYVCLKFSILWGLCCVLVVDVVHPPINKFVMWLSPQLQYSISGVVLIAFAADIYVTVATIVEWKRSIRVMKGIAENLHAFSDEVGDGICNAVLKTVTMGTEVKANIEQLETYQDMKLELENGKQELESIYQAALKLRKLQNVFFQKRIQKAFPNITAPTVETAKGVWHVMRKKAVRKNEKK